MGPGAESSGGPVGVISWASDSRLALWLFGRRANIHATGNWAVFRNGRFEPRLHIGDGRRYFVWHLDRVPQSFGRFGFGRLGSESEVELSR